MKENNAEVFKTKFTSHSIAVTDRKKATLTGVVRVESSNATEIILVSCLGRLVISGSELKIERFDEASGDLALSGNIDGIKYTAAKQSLLKRIFK
ncbi:MAG: YabP/YqfC family sporulation protein [Clostridiales bacterium]|nr:YabP/YqfC family sporulation protein [Clostridiales bacterium]